MNKNKATQLLQAAIVQADKLLGLEHETVYIGSQHWGTTHLLQTSAYFAISQESIEWAGHVLETLKTKTARVHVAAPIQFTAVRLDGTVKERFVILVSIWF